MIKTGERSSLFPQFREANDPSSSQTQQPLKPNPEHSRFGGRNVASATYEFEFGRVAGYRLYGLDGVNKVASADWIDADDDEIAIEAAKERYDGRECELWHGRRLVARLNLRRSD